jgi:hypothetical protein
MFRVVDRLFQGPAFHRDAPRLDGWDVVLWWEKRRLFYNLVVGGTGIVTCILLVSCAVLAEPLIGDAIGMPDPPIFGIIGIFLYGIMANVCYAAGWFVELVLTRLRSGGDTTAFGVRAFRLGLQFSIGLTLFPALLAWAEFLFYIATGRRPELTQP